MRISTLGSLWPRLEAAEGKESAKKGERRKGETEFAEGSGQPILINGITKVKPKEAFPRSKMKNIARSLAVWNHQMADRTGKGLIARSPLMRDLVARGITERNLIEKGDIQRSPSMMNLTTIIVMRRWKI
jgi:hypothetical protein